MVPPVPIPNTEVKRCSPNDSASLGGAKVGRRQSYRPAPHKGAGRLLFNPSGCPRSWWLGSEVLSPLVLQLPRADKNGGGRPTDKRLLRIIRDQR